MQVTGGCYCGAVRYKVVGEPKGFQRDDIQNPALREFCPNCGTHLLTRSPRAPSALLIKVGTLYDPVAYGLPMVAIYAREMQSFHAVPAGFKAFEGRP